MWNKEDFEKKLRELNDDEFDNALQMMLTDGVKVEIPEHIEAILKSFQKINKSIVFLDTETSTMREDKRIFAICNSFSMPISFALTSLNKLLLALKSVKVREIVIYDDHLHIFRQDGEDTKEMIVHHHDNFDLIASPAAAYEQNNMDNIFEMMGMEEDCSDADLVFKLTNEDLKSIKDANKVMDGKENKIIFTFKDGTMSTTISDEADEVPDVWKTVTPINYDGEEFELIYYPLDMQFIDGNYTVYAYEDGIAVFKLDPIEVDGEEIDLKLSYIVTTGNDD